MSAVLFPTCALYFNLFKIDSKEQETAMASFVIFIQSIFSLLNTFPTDT